MGLSEEDNDRPTAGEDAAEPRLPTGPRLWTGPGTEAMMEVRNAAVKRPWTGPAGTERATSETGCGMPFS